MAAITIKKFSGIAPRFAKRKLNPSYAQVALNCDLWSGEARSLRDSLVANTPTKTGIIRSIFKLSDIFLHWNEDVDVVRAPLSTSDADRIYYSGHYNAKSTNLELAKNGAGTDYPLDWYRLGLPAPDNAAIISVTGSAVTRDYVYTFVTAWGEESPPSPIVTDTGDTGATWNLSSIDTAPLNSGTITNIVVSGGKATFTVSAAHLFETGDYINITGIVGVGNLPLAFNNVGPLQVTRISSTQFTLALSPSGTYTSGGSWSRESNIQTTDMVKRIYRTVSGKFRFVDEIDVATTTYADNKSDTLLGEELPSENWLSPPPDIKGLINLPNGVLAGFKDNTLHLSEPFIPHAFPPDYDQRFSYKIVGIASIGSNIVVATEGNPYIVVGNDPAFMTTDELDLFQSCVAKRSVTSVKNGVIYASPDGLVYVPSAGVPHIITREWLKEVDWRKLNPASMTAAVYDDRYYAFFDNAVDERDGITRQQGAIVFDPSEPDSTFTTLAEYATAAYNHLEDDSLFLMINTEIMDYGKGGGFGTLQWKSKQFIIGHETTMQAAQVKFSFEDGINSVDKSSSIAAAVAAVDAMDGSVTGTFGGQMVGAYAVGSGPYYDSVKSIVGSIRSAIFKLYVKDELFYEKQLVDSRPFRLPGGYNADEYEVELSGGSVRFHEVTIAETISDLQSV